MFKMNERQTVTAICKEFDKVYSFAGYNSFYDGLELMYCTLTRFQSGQEEKYMEIVKRHGDDFPRIISKVFSMLYKHFSYDRNFEDILGQVYMETGWYRKPAGQFFTPFNLALMVARMQLGEGHTEKSPDDYPLKVLDPACGSGVMLLAFKQAIAEKFDREAIRYYRFYGQDIDATCVLMTRIQLLMTDDWYMSNLMLATAGDLKRKLDLQSVTENPVLPELEIKADSMGQLMFI